MRSSAQVQPRHAAAFHPLLPAVLLFLLVVLAYSSVLSGGFIWDDDAYVTENVHLRTVDGLAAIWFEPGATPQYYPLVFTLFWLQFKLWGLAPLGYHLVNIFLHAANAVLFWRCLQKLALPSPFWIAALFALHPVHVESVAWITELKNVLSAFFVLLSFLLYWKFSSEPLSGRLRVVCYGLSLFCFLLALLSKSVTVTLPAVLLLFFWWKRGAFSLRDVARLLPFFGLALLLGWNTAKLEVTHVLATGAEWDFSFIDRLLIAGRAVWFYAGKLLWPHPLIFNYERWQIDASVWWQYLFPLGVIAVAVVLWVLRNRTGRGPLAGYLFFIGTLFPALGFFNVYPMRYSFVADHFQYLSSIGVIALLVSGIVWLIRQKGCSGTTETALFVPLLLLLAGLTWQQGWIYRDRMTLFSDTIEKNPRSWLSYTNRGRDYALAGRDDLALADVEKSLVINPDDADALQIRGAIALKRRDFERAIADMSRSVQLYPDRVEYLRNRSLAYRNAGLLQEAIADAAHVIKLSPQDFEAYLYRASLYAAAGNLNEAGVDLEFLARIGFEITAVERKRILSPR